MLKKKSMVSLGRQENASTASEENDSERSQKVRQPGSVVNPPVGDFPKWWWF